VDYTRQANGSTERGSPKGLDLLREYDAAGIKLVKVGDHKNGVDKGWPEKRVQSEEITRHFKRGGNVGWLMGAASDWLCAVDPDCPEAEKLAPRFLPTDSLQQRKGDEPPSTYFYRSPGLGFETFKDLDSETIMDLKASSNGKGHLVVVEPSTHATKGQYKFVRGFDADKILEVEREELRARVGELAVATLIARYLPQKGRHDVAMALSGLLLRNGEPQETVLKILSEAWKVNNAPEEGLRDLKGIVRDTETKLKGNEPVKGGRTLENTIPGMPKRIATFLGWQQPEVKEGRQSYNRTDLGNAERLVHRHGYNFRYVPPWGRDLVFDGKRWKMDDILELRRMAKDTVRKIYGEAEHAPDETTRKAIAKHAFASEAESRLSSMISLARSEEGIPVLPDQLDTNPWLFNTLNGTIDLRTGELRPHNRGDLITKLAPVEYNPDAKAPTFNAFLEKVLPPGVIKFVRKGVGYSLTGDVSEQALFFLHGSGANGKTTLMNAVLGLSGDYGMQAAPDLLVAKGNTHPTELADLFGARFVASTEVEDGRRLAENLTKQLTGGDRIKARYMRQDFWEFSPTHKIWLAANHKPEVRGTDYAIWRRIKLIPFEVTIPKAEQDPRLPEKLKEELPGILAWAVRGCLEWRAEGLGEPEEVTRATESYRAEQDVLAAFIEECCWVDGNAQVKFKDLWTAYQEWCQEAGEHSGSRMKFGKRLDERGFENRRGGKNVAMRAGLGLLYREGKG